MQQRRFTNNILFMENQQKIQILIPVYLCIDFTRVLQSSKTSQLSMMAMLKLSILVHLLPDTLLETIRTSMQISFNSKQHITLSKNKYILTELDPNNMLTFIYDAKIPMTESQNHSFLAPFDLKHLETVIVIRSLETIYKDKKTYIRFNFMDTQVSEEKFNIKNEVQSVGEYGIASSYTNAVFSNSLNFQDLKPENQQTKIKKLQYWQYSKYSVVLYRYPINLAFKIFLPMWCLGLANIFGYFIEDELQQRIFVVVILMVGYLLLAITMNNTYFIGGKITLIDTNRFLMFSIVVLYLVNSVLHQHAYKLTIWFILSVSIMGSSIIFLMVLIFLHKALWQPKYRKGSYRKGGQFNSGKWYNQECDQYYTSIRTHLQEISKLK